MKRSFIITLALILCASSGWARMNPVMLGGGVAANGGPVYTDCSNIGSSSLYWTGDHASGTSIACTQAGTKTLSVSEASIVDSSADPGVSSSESGGYVGKCVSASSSIFASVSNRDIIDDAEGYFKANVYFSSTAGSLYILRYETIASDYINVTVTSSGAISIIHKGGGGTVTVSLNSSDTLTTAVWNTVEVRWSVANNQIAVNINDSGWETDTDPDAVTAFSTTSTVVSFGKVTSTSFVYVDDFRLSKSSGL